MLLALLILLTSYFVWDALKRVQPSEYRFLTGLVILVGTIVLIPLVGFLATINKNILSDPQVFFGLVVFGQATGLKFGIETVVKLRKQS